MDHIHHYNGFAIELSASLYGMRCLAMVDLKSIIEVHVYSRDHSTSLAACQMAVVLSGGL